VAKGRVSASRYHPGSMRRAIPLIVIAVIGLAALAVDFWPGLRLPSGDPSNPSRTIETKLGLDLQGGLAVEYQAQCVEGKCPSKDDLSVIRDIMERRVNATGVAEPVVTTQGSDRIVVELPGVSDPQAVRRLVGQTGRLEFVPITASCPPATEGQKLDLEVCPPLFAGGELSNANVGTDETGRPAVNFELRSDGASKFAEYTRANVGQQFAIVLDEVVISAPVIRSPITDGRGQISGSFSIKEATDLSTVLRYGSLPFPVAELSAVNISPTLGDQFLRAGLTASAIALALVIVFMLLHYRLPGVVAAFALLYYVVVVLAIFRLIPVTLTLAGIAGFVLSIGMAVDANILIFERTKEELRFGKTLGAAVEAGFARAWNSILDSNVSSLITAAILYWFGTSVIRGFALVLMIGVLVSMFSAVTVTRTLLRLFVDRGWARKAWLYGVTDEEFVARPAGRPVREGARGRV
jgi:preprotein translocase subunit SecD